MKSATLDRVFPATNDPRDSVFIDVRFGGKRVGQVERFRFSDGIFGYWFRFDGEVKPAACGIDGEDWRMKVKVVVNRRMQEVVG